MVSVTTSGAVRANGRWIAVATIAGLLAGALTLVGQAVLPTEANRLANSGAVWVTVAFLVGRWTPSDGSAAVAGLLTLLAALAGYFIAAALAHAPVSVSTVAIWVVVALAGGPVFGVAGRWWSTRDGWPFALAIGALGGVYLAEGVWTLLSVPHMALAGWVSTAIGLALPVCLGRDRPSRLRGVLLLAPLAALGVAGFAAIDRAFSSVSV